MTVIIRDFRPEPSDIASMVQLRRATLPYNLTTAASVAANVASAPAEAKNCFLVAEDSATGEIVGALQARLHHLSSEPGHASCIPVVLPGRRGQGIGSALRRAGEEHVSAHGATTLHAWALDARSAAYAEKLGYAPAHSMHYQRLDLVGRALPQPPPLPAGLTLISAARLGDDPRPLYGADAEATQDEPNSVPVALEPYEEWLVSVWNRPLLDRELTTLAVTDDGTVAAFTLAETDGETRYSSGMTGTRRDFRGLGLAKAAKHDSLSRARAAGYREAFTSNDDVNAPMLAINKWFGYEHGNTEVEYVRTLG
ncbi:GNAT family N-acetyltransferase [Streptomyces sp. NPDC048442]|uniref:GNAT family N-acetyltransferase n=1 Tax=Streptomyces sp. NPDC048442 TaxID=3154823 RepID=UPI00343E8A05